MPLTREDRIANLAKARAAKAAKLDAALDDVDKKVEASAIPVPVDPPVASEIHLSPVTPDEVMVNDVKEDTTPVHSFETPSTVTTATASLDKPEEITLESLDTRQLEVCIADVCWKGKEITITRQQHEAFVAKGNLTFKYMDLVLEVARILKEGGYLFHQKGKLL